MEMPFSLPFVAPARFRWRDPLVMLIALMALTLGVALVGLALDPRVITGAPAWLKPAKFAVSIIIYAATLWLLLPALADRPRLAKGIGWAVLIGLGLEMALIALQAARGTTSHFNFATSFDALVFRVMGGVIMAIWVLTMLVAVLLFRRSFAPAPLRWGVRLGLIGAILGMAVALLMPLPTPPQMDALSQGAQLTIQGAHSVGVVDGGPGLPILGWSTVGGDLRIGHFVGLHALQAVPLFALALMRWAPAWLPARGQAQMTGIFGGFWIALTLLLTWQALRGQPVTAPDGMTLAGFAGLLAVTALGMVAVVGRARP
ncbi:MAG: hypothetical protein QM692_11820 [Thermomicrobiales bacterium]